MNLKENNIKTKKQISFREFVELQNMFIVEGIDIDYTKKLVNINTSHENYLETNNNHLIKANIDGTVTYSIFKRKKGSGDANPLIKALKNIDNWKTEDYSLKFIDAKIITLSKKISADTIVLAASSNNYLSHLANLIKTSIEPKNFIKDIFVKLNAEDVMMCDNVLALSNKQKDILVQSLENMKQQNKGIFSFKFVPPDLRKYFTKCIDLSTTYYPEEINNKDVLIVDDTITSGKTISQSVDAIKSMYFPKSITVITLFSKLY